MTVVRLSGLAAAGAVLAGGLPVDRRHWGVRWRSASSESSPPSGWGLGGLGGIGGLGGEAIGLGRDVIVAALYPVPIGGLPAVAVAGTRARADDGVRSDGERGRRGGPVDYAFVTVASLVVAVALGLPAAGAAATGDHGTGARRRG